jgi:tight adherence protein C
MDEIPSILDLLAIATAGLGPFGPLIALGGFGLLLVGLALAALLGRRGDPFDRLSRSRAAAASSATEGDLRSGGRHDKLEKYATFLEPQDQVEFSAVRLRLVQAGYRTRAAVRTYHFAQFALGLGLMAAGGLWIALQAAGAGVATQTAALALVMPGGAGYMLPKYWVTRRRATRREEIFNGFPDALDMMLVCVEAGQSLDQSVLRVAREIRAGYPALADEFQIVSHELKAGKERVQVLRDMAERAGVPDVASFVTVLVQSQQFGTSVAEALRVYAAEMRDKRVMRAEEKANTLPTKMTLATMLLTVPPLLIILLGPSVYNIAVTLGGIGQ